MRELWEETPCEHGEVKRHPTPVVLPDHLGPGRDDVGYDWSNMCPGGSRRELTIDYEAAGRALAAEVSKVRTEGNRKFLGVNVRTVVDAALLTEETG